MNAIVKDLNRLAYVKLQMDILTDKQEGDILSLLDDEIKKKITAINKKYADKQAKLTKEASELELSIRKNTLEYGETVKGEELKAIYISGRVSWNDDKLMGYAVIHPEILSFRTKGSSYITIKK